VLRGRHDELPVLGDIRIFDHPPFAEPLRDRIRECAQQVCDASGMTIEHVSKSHNRKEDLVARVLAARGDAPGLVHVISAMESCKSYKPRTNKTHGHVFPRPDTGKCLHYYFHFVSCWAFATGASPPGPPFALQFYCNGHSALARRLQREDIEFVQEDTVFLRISDLERAQALADAFSRDWHWSIRQAEYSTDFRFCSRESRIPLYDALSRQRSWPPTRPVWPPFWARRSPQRWHRSLARDCPPPSRAPASSTRWAWQP
jgi:hypothetical protein